MGGAAGLERSRPGHPGREAGEECGLDGDVTCPWGTGLNHYFGVVRHVMSDHSLGTDVGVSHHDRHGLSCPQELSKSRPESNSPERLKG